MVPARRSELVIRIERIRTWRDLARWALDQLGHVAIVLCAVCPVLWLGLWGVPVAGVLVLSIREWEQWRSKSDAKKLAQAMMPLFERHIDRVVDVGAGTLGALAILVAF